MALNRMSAMAWVVVAGTPQLRGTDRGALVGRRPAGRRRTGTRGHKSAGRTRPADVGSQRVLVSTAGTDWLWVVMTGMAGIIGGDEGALAPPGDERPVLAGLEAVVVPTKPVEQVQEGEVRL